MSGPRLLAPPGRPRPIPDDPYFPLPPRPWPFLFSRLMRFIGGKEMTMSDERQQILEMLREGKITTDEAERLLYAVGNSAAREKWPFGGFAHVRRRVHEMHREHGHGPGRPKFLRVVIDRDQNGKRERMRIKVPIKLLRAGISLAGLLPKDAREGITAELRARGLEADLFALRSDNIDELIGALSDVRIKFGNREQIRIYTVGSEDDDDGIEIARDDDDDDDRDPGRMGL